jgi:DNA modification methylase
MNTRVPTVAERRKYAVKTVSEARKVAFVWIENMELSHALSFGLPEVDDRYHVWRVPLLSNADRSMVGEVVLDARTSLVVLDKSTGRATLEARLLGRKDQATRKRAAARSKSYEVSCVRNTIAQGDSEFVLLDFPANCVDLVFTSPPYFNARPEYEEYLSYEEYLLKIRRILRNTYRVLAEGRFFVMNVSPILIRRPSRNASSKRIAVPFDIHRLFIEEGYEFIDDIIWLKPEGAGWATGRGRRFAADRNPLQYKPVPVTEYVLVYRKKTDKLIDWNIRAHPDQKLVKESRIKDPYERTNVWRIKPSHDPKHPAVFPLELARKVILYYSFKSDVVLDPFAGIGTAGLAAVQTGRRFVLIESDPRYVDIMREQVKRWLHSAAKDVLTINCPPVEVEGILL